MTTIRPKLTPEQKSWMDDLPEEAHSMVESVLWQEGEAYFLENWTALKNQMDYALTLL